MIKMYFEVIAENGVNKIVYRLTPNASASDAFVTSSVFMVDQDAALIDLVPEGTTTQGLMANLVPAPGASMKLVDKFGYERMFGNVAKDDKLVVTAEDGETTKTYYLQILGVESSILAYVLSDVYYVDQVEYFIRAIVSETTEVSEFIANLIPAPGASVKVMDSEGNENTGTLHEGDLLMVTASDGVTVVTYSIVFPTGFNNLDKNRILVYPNPASDRVTISGLERGDRIKVNNILGVLILDRTAVQDMEVIPMGGQRNGVYFITVTNSDKVIGRYKLILK